MEYVYGGPGSQHQQQARISIQSCRSSTPCRTLQPIACPTIVCRRVPRLATPIPPLRRATLLGGRNCSTPISVNTFKFKASSARAAARGSACSGWLIKAAHVCP